MALSLIAADDDDGRRLDRILRKALPNLPLSALHKLLRKGKVQVNGKKARPETRVNSGETISIQGLDNGDDAKGANREKPRAAMHSSESALDILYEHDGLLILNKPAGLAAHGEDSLEEQVLSYLMPKLPPSLSFKPGPLHRLDKPSSGVIAFSTNLEGARNFSALVRDRKIRKLYLAIVDGLFENIDAPIIWEDNLTRDKDEKKTFVRDESTEKSQKALTAITPVAASQSHTLVLAEIETGRTHQIRAQAAAHGHPLSGDKKYGAKPLPDCRGFFLHAWVLEFNLQRIRAPLPENFRREISGLFGKEVLQNLEKSYTELTWFKTIN
ncbi:RluA family pseudouridine synthase [Leadbettera azotonutricia]|uniref:Pseudouridine synthase, RluA family n=1 Tax=Leadbettera azotonutricia (strain ATCC BAA-888 / DSM 13862 / ZAS-9) TaxID=545695 RepID=F5YE42_LEAAZ|nr:RluA family pseudouridine synthase [Leadbettera azotonutricia]AEF82989.1 pseudouridine synthase, RluA family [Leadbettera azotonutricia ZAS-9]